jgi:hypothetical protein
MRVKSTTLFANVVYFTMIHYSDYYKVERQVILRTVNYKLWGGERELPSLSAVPEFCPVEQRGTPPPKKKDLSHHRHSLGLDSN